MSEENLNQTPSPTEPTLPVTDSVNPDKLLGDFRGKPLLIILLIVLVLHVIFIGVFTVGGMAVDMVFSRTNTEEQSEDARMESAVKDSESELRKIAEAHGVSYAELMKQMNQGRSRVAAPAAADATSPSAGSETPDLSDYERSIEDKETEGPDVPDLTGGIDEEDDLFAPDAP